jgi:hypothetical protein
MPRLPQQATAAILGTILAVGIPAGSAFAASVNARHGVEVSAMARTNIARTGGHGAVVSAVARSKPAPPPVTLPVTPVAEPAPTAHPTNHGADVSAVAKDHEVVGGSNENHGGAVAPVAHKP